MFENILNNVSKCISLTEEEKSIFTSFFEIKKFPKKTTLLREGEICQFEGYIQKGCVRTYYLDENGHDVVLSFGIEDWWVSDISSFQEQKPSQFFIETLEETEIYMLNLERKEKILSVIPKLERVFRLLVQRNLAALQNRFVHTVAQSAAERYLEFIKLYPSIPLRVPQYYIASYLGVSPEFVSIIRKRIAKNKS